jgi:hypothetical protein
MSRDPIEEQGGVNLYTLLFNDPVDKTDALGREEVVVQEHHPIPHSNKKWNHGDHPLVKCAGVKLETEQKLVSLEGHMGRHSDSYQQEIRRRLNLKWESLKSKTRETSKKALESLVDEIIRDIESGKLRPYESKGVRVVGSSVAKTSSSRGVSVNAIKALRGKSLIIIDVMTLIPGTFFEIEFIRSRMKSGVSFPGAVKDLWEYYKERDGPTGPTTG